MNQAAPRLEIAPGLLFDPVDVRQLSYLIIDDSRYARHFIKDGLQAFGMRRIFEASDGVAGLKILKAEKIDLVLVDKEMPLLTGTEFTMIVRRGERDVPNPQVPIIMVSGFTDEETVREAMAAGVHEFLAKPFSAAALFKRIETTINQPRPFIHTEGYIGPDRRTAPAAKEAGRERRIQRRR